MEALEEDEVDAGEWGQAEQAARSTTAVHSGTAARLPATRPRTTARPSKVTKPTLRPARRRLIRHSQPAPEPVNSDEEFRLKKPTSHLSEDAAPPAPVDSGEEFRLKRPTAYFEEDSAELPLFLSTFFPFRACVASGVDTRKECRRGEGHGESGPGC